MKKVFLPNATISLQLEDSKWFFAFFCIIYWTVAIVAIVEVLRGLFLKFHHSTCVLHLPSSRTIGIQVNFKVFRTSSGLSGLLRWRLLGSKKFQHLPSSRTIGSQVNLKVPCACFWTFGIIDYYQVIQVHFVTQKLNIK